MRKIYKIYEFLFWLPFFGVYTVFIASSAVISSIFLKKRAGNFLGLIWARLLVYLVPFSVTVEGKKNLDSKKSYIIIANHSSHLDIFVIMGWVSKKIRFIMKKELRKIPIFGLACARVGHVYIDRSNRQKAIESLENAKATITDGRSLLFFPEGTRNNKKKLLDFKKGAFHTAINLGLPILPVTINGTGKILPARTFDLFPGKAYAIIHPPIETKDYSVENINELVKKSREIINSKRVV